MSKDVTVTLTKNELYSLHGFVYAALCFKGDNGDKHLNSAYEKLMHLRADTPHEEVNHEQK